VVWVVVLVVFIVISDLLWHVHAQITVARWLTWWLSIDLSSASTRTQWLKCNGTQGNAVPPPPIYGSKRSSTSDCYNARERHTTIVKGPNLNVAFPHLNFCTLTTARTYTVSQLGVVHICLYHRQITILFNTLLSMSFPVFRLFVVRENFHITSFLLI